MKKFLAFVLTAAMIVSFAACKKNENKPGSSPSGTEGTAPAATAGLTAAVQDIEGKVAEYAVVLKPQVDYLAQQLEGTMGLDCYAEGKSIVCEYKFLSEELQTDAAALKASLDASGESYVPMYQELAEYVGSDEVSVILRYLGADGEKILDYIVDKDYEPGEGSSVKNHYDSLEEFVDSEEFEAMLAQSSVPGVETTALVEDGNTVVYVQKVKNELTEEGREEFRNAWLEGIQESGDAAAQTFVSAIKLVVDIDDVGFVFRVVDKDGEIIAEYTANVR